ncbi:G-protein coupled receptor 20 [Anarrhichthys ocellatus]|uniref:G-protein coupled receptor 20 n=1 Tax=Anarrhichthys ocellatus TaxID=433405 RepID=UPI0012EDB058|nr:G-protein coupled receptor 20-like [Anarrhichthys ocellatus]
MDSVISTIPNLSFSHPFHPMESLLTNISSTSTTEPLLTPDPTNCSTWDQRWGAPYLHRLAHLDMQLYQDFYAVWVSLMVCNGLMLVVGVVLNSLALYVFCGASTHTSASVVYTINLAVADLMVALSLPARIALYHSGGSCVACSYVHTFSYFVNMYCSILFLTSICIDRYLAVVHASSTLHRCRTTGTAKCVSATVWFIAVVVTYSFQTTALEFSSSCVLLPALFYLTILEFLLPLLAVVGFTLRVACFLSSSHGLMPQQSRARRARAVRLLATVLVVFTICFTPFHVRQVLVYFRVKVRGEGIGQGAGHVLAYHITVTLSSLNSCLDPVVYCFVTDSFKRLWRTRRGAREGDGEAGHTSGGEGERNSVNKCPGTALVIAHSMATLTLTSSPLSAANMEHST